MFCHCRLDSLLRLLDRWDWKSHLVDLIVHRANPILSLGLEVWCIVLDDLTECLLFGGGDFGEEGVLSKGRGKE